MENSLISIVIPTYNSQKTILKCLNSCIIQTYKYYEIIIIDDCSMDDTINIIERFIVRNELFNIKLIKLEENSGPSTARNIGINLANGELIALLDSDDFFHPEKLEIINNIFYEHDSIDMLGHNYCIQNFTKKEKEYFKIKEKYELKKVNCYKLLLKNFAVTPSIVFRKRNITRFNEKMRFTEDHDFFIRTCLSNYNIFYLNCQLVCLNRELLTQGGQSSDNLKMRLGEIKMYFNLYKINKKLIPIVPFLIFFSFSKYILKLIIKKRTNDTN